MQHRIMESLHGSGMLPNLIEGGMQAGLSFVNRMGETGETEDHGAHEAAQHEGPVPPPRRHQAAQEAGHEENGLPASPRRPDLRRTSTSGTSGSNQSDEADEAAQVERQAQADAMREEQAAMQSEEQDGADHHDRHHTGGHAVPRDPIHSSGVSPQDRAALDASGQGDMVEKYDQLNSNTALRGIQNRHNIDRLKRSDAHQRDLGRVGM
ncbi:MAG: hypothetical protein V4754_18890 [Pseudomonadota bacterium]